MAFFSGICLRFGIRREIQYEFMASKIEGKIAFKNEKIFFILRNLFWISSQVNSNFLESFTFCLKKNEFWIIYWFDVCLRDKQKREVKKISNVCKRQAIFRWWWQGTSIDASLSYSHTSSHLSHIPHLVLSLIKYKNKSIRVLDKSFNHINK